MRAVRGGCLSFDEFFRTTFSRLVLFVIKLGASREEAEDAAQEAMTRVYQSWNVVEHPHAWVRVVAERAYLASSARARTDLDKAGRSTWVEGSYREDADMAIFAEQVRVVQTLLRRLPYEQRRAMAWHYDGFTTSEIAEAMGKPPATIRSHLRHARERLRAVLVDADMPEQEGR